MDEKSRGFFAAGHGHAWQIDIFTGTIQSHFLARHIEGVTFHRVHSVSEVHFRPSVGFGMLRQQECRLDNFTGGAAGVLVPLKADVANFQFADKRAFYWVALAFVALALWITQHISRTRFGAQLVAVRENEDAARALGVDAFRTKLKAITLSGAITATAGCLYTQKFLYIDANLAFGPWISVEALLAPIIGGVGTVLGPLAGAVLLLGLGEVTKNAFAVLLGGSIPGVDLVVFGVLLILCVAFAPNGVMGALKRLASRKGAAT